VIISSHSLPYAVIRVVQVAVVPLSSADKKLTALWTNLLEDPVCETRRQAVKSMCSATLQLETAATTFPPAAASEVRVFLSHYL